MINCSKSSQNNLLSRRKGNEKKDIAWLIEVIMERKEKKLYVKKKDYEERIT